MDEGSPESHSYQLFMLVLCVCTIVGLAAEATLTLAPQSRLILHYADTGICGLFLLDFCLSLRRARNRWRYLRTWGWLDLVSRFLRFTSPVGDAPPRWSGSFVS
jgi:voltage-gated potassium channel